MRSVLMLMLLLLAPTVYARDGGGIDRPHVCGEMSPGPRLDKCQNWISTLQRPDRLGSCCGDGDSFITDVFETDAAGELWAIITADYPDQTFTDEEGNTVTAPATIHKGSRIHIPHDAINHAAEDANNTSGHGVVFLRPSDQSVLCYNFPPLT